MITGRDKDSGSSEETGNGKKDPIYGNDDAHSTKPIYDPKKLKEKKGEGNDPGKYLVEDRGKTYSDFEAELTDQNVERSIRYMTQCIEELQFEQAIVNLATTIYKRMPLSNSILLGALAMDDGFRTRGYNFSSKELERDSSIRFQVRREKLDLLEKLRELNIRALNKQHSYLSTIAKKSGLFIPSGAIFECSPFSSINEIREAQETDPSLRYDGELKSSKDFVISLLGNEPQYAKIFSEIFKGKEGDLRNYLFENFSEEMKFLD